MVSTISSDKPGSLLIGIGITRRKGPNGSGTFTRDPGAGATWDKGLDCHDRAGWEAYVREQKPDFDPEKQ